MTTKTGERAETALRAARKKRQLTVQHVAAMLRIDSSNLSRIELGAQMPTKRIARELYAFYRGEVELGDIYDATFKLETGGRTSGRARAGN